jgi:hypothetical protein
LSTFIAISRFFICERSFWHVTTMPVGRWVMRMAESVLLTCWPPAPVDSVRVDAQVLRVDDDRALVCALELGHDFDQRERGVAAMVLVEGRYAHQSVHSVL